MDDTNLFLNIKRERKESETKQDISFSLFGDSPVNVKDEDLYDTTLNPSEDIDISNLSKIEGDSILELLNDIRKQRILQNEYMLINSTLTDAYHSNYLKEHLPPAVYNKVTAIIVSNDVKNCYGHYASQDNILGLAPPDEELSSDEAYQLKQIMEDLLETKCAAVKSDINQQSYLLGDMAAENEETIRLQEELNNVSLKYSKSLLGLQNLLEEFCSIRQNIMPNIMEQETRILKQKILTTEMKVRSENSKVIRRLYCEHPNTLKAIEKIADHVNREMVLCDNQLLELQSKEASYENMKDNEEYKQILKEYRELSNKIKYKERVIASL